MNPKIRKVGSHIVLRELCLIPPILEGIFLNLCLCVPVGYLLPLAFLQRGKRLCFWQVVCAGAAVSAVIELTQFVTCLGMLEMDDWLFNTMGTALGYLLYRKLFSQDARECALPAMYR